MVKVLAGIKVKDASLWLPRFIIEMEKLRGVTRIIIFYGESRDSTFALLDHWRNNSKTPIEIYSDPYFPPNEKFGAASSARVDTEFQTLLREGDEDYFLKIDCDIVQIPEDMVERLIADDLDLVAPYVWTEGRETKTFFDIYVFRVEGSRFHPHDPPGKDSDVPIEVDCVGSCWLAKREGYLKGKYSNPHPDIPFCNSLRNQGYRVWADPTINIVHVDLERYGIVHRPASIALSRAPYIMSSGKKVMMHVAQAHLFYGSVLDYQKFVKKKCPDQTVEVTKFKASRSLVTACYKVLNEAKFFKYSLESVYDYVDKIVIVEGAVSAMWNNIKVNKDGSSTDDTVEIINSFPDPKNKIKLIQGRWINKEQMQAKLLEQCTSKWLFYIDGDEIFTKKSMKNIRRFCEQNQDGKIVYARPNRYFTFWHDWYHIAYDLNPLSPWYKYGFPHAGLVWCDVPGLNFAELHTIPHDGFGSMLGFDDPAYRGRETVLDNVEVYHFGNAKGVDKMYEKMKLPHQRSLGSAHSREADPWFSGVLPPQMILETFKGRFPKVLKGHPDRNVKRIRITKTKPHFEFEVI